MKITLHRDDIGVTDTGQWVRRSAEGWLAIDKPSWASKKPGDNSFPPLAMTDPYERKPQEIPLVTVRRVITQTVPDYQAEVLLRQGWELVTSNG